MISSACPPNMLFFVQTLSAHADELGNQSRRVGDAVAHAAARCQEYSLGSIPSMSGRLMRLSRRNTELANQVRGVATTFSIADRQSLTLGTVGASPPSLWQQVASLQQATQEWVADVERGIGVVNDSITNLDRWAWNTMAFSLLEALRELNASEDVDFRHIRPVLIDLAAMLGLIMVGDGEWLFKPNQPMEQLKIIHQGFWNMAFNKVDPAILLPLAEEIERLNLRMRGTLFAAPHARPQPWREFYVWAIDAFVGSQVNYTTGQIDLPAWSLMAGEHSAISPYYNEQVTWQQIQPHEHIIAICGLDPGNMHAAPNGLVAVLLTAYGHDPLKHSYYQLVKQRFLAYLDHIPPGDTLNFTGHSMGGGMTMMLLNDPEIQQRLLADGYQIHSITTYGAVRPEDPQRNGFPPSQPSPEIATLLANTEVRFYVDPEDRLAMNVGAGHLDANGMPLPNVYFVENNKLDDPIQAHTSYDDPKKYRELPPELQQLPFAVDSPSFHSCRHPDQIPLLDNPPPMPDEPPEITLPFG
ncbi:hypothetical protein [Candidatus Oscillochloris fontis]|uniref:hypothetical protein n=1 Tax=Candidatus Oscillochloris fontis TaxID=2496868 RepID=UPI00101DA7B1|nr:hypothetical protein [Candidatus Oscillochloris fontis]